MFWYTRSIPQRQLHRFAVQSDLGDIVFKNGWIQGIQNDLVMGNRVRTDWVASETVSERRWGWAWRRLTYSLGNSPRANEHSSEVLPQAPVVAV